MVRLVIVIAVLAVGVVVVKQRSDRRRASPLPAAPPVNSAQVPAEFRRLLADAPDPAPILRERGALPGLGAIRRLAGDVGVPTTTSRGRGRSPTSARGAS